MAVFLIGFLFGKLASKKLPTPVLAESASNGRENSQAQKWNFINPLLDCGELNNIPNKTISDMRQKVVDFIDKQKIKGVDDAAVYFRDLNNGPWFGIKEKDGFLPASLLKVPLMMNVFKQAMGDPSFLSKQFTWQGESLNKEHFKAENELENNKTYSVSEALSYMIRYSDNNATYVLNYAIDTSTLTASYSDLGVAPPDQANYAISARTYGSFFRILYNSTFLNKEYSEKALRLLSETQFNKGLVAGVPSSIKVAHKFGERQVDDAKQLHDCGIVYYPDKPYLLCVMTRGNDFDKLASFIAQVSKKVYEVVDEEK
ncbi:MAG: beta-lactamase [Parcubacteria group bacterium Gr01-1014_13]|nr:MAG: beta-lactamase [Parcubacteria group bacterium Gr01-1014_13]